MTVIEVQALTNVRTYLPQIAKELKRIADALETKTCCICGKTFKGHGHNPHPVEIEGVCCDECNAKVVMKRIAQLESEVENG